MKNREKAIGALAIIMEELNMPKGSTIGDIAHALAIIDPTSEILNLIRPLIRNAAIDEIKQKIA